jgi:hypothetical protein
VRKSPLPVLVVRTHEDVPVPERVLAGARTAVPEPSRA